MCFSASSSFTVGAFLVPIGVYAAYSALELKRYHYLLLSLVPLFFGIQQIIEGGVWLAMAAHSAHYIHLFSLGFLFFSHFFWPFWIPLSAYMIAKNHHCNRTRVMLGFAVVGFVLGLMVYIPFLLKPDAVQTAIRASSIQYSVHTIFDALGVISIGKYIYIAIIIIPLWICRDWAVKIMGFLIFFSVIATYLFYNYAFNSVWCYFSAVISMYIIYIIRRTKDFGLNVVVKDD